MIPAGGMTDQPTNGVIVNALTPIYFDETNSSLVSTYLSNQITNFDVYFIGSGWTATDVTNWDNTGDIYFRDSVQLSILSSDINGSVFIEGAVILEFDATTISNIEIKADNSQLNFDTCTVGTISNGNVWGTHFSSTITLISSTLNGVSNAVSFFGDGSIKKSLLLADTKGMNITMDILSTINGRFDVRNSKGSSGNYEIEGIDGISFSMTMYGYFGASQVYIHDLTIDRNSYLHEIYNLTISNIIFNYGADYSSTNILYISSSNGKVTNAIDPLTGGRLLRIYSFNSNITFADIDMGGIIIEGDTFDNHNYKVRISSSHIRGDIEVYSWQNIWLDDVLVDGYFVKLAVALGPVSSWVSYSEYSNMQIGIIFNTSNSVYNLEHKFDVPSGVEFTVEDRVFDMYSLNATITILGTEIIKAYFDEYSQVTVYDSVVSAYSNGDNVKYQFFNTNFTDSTYDSAAINVTYYFEDCNVNARFYIGSVNITSINSYFMKFWVIKGTDIIQRLNFTDSYIESFNIGASATNTYYWNFKNSEINVWYGDNGESGVPLNIVLDHSMIGVTFNFDWAAVPNLVTIQSTLDLDPNWEYLKMKMIYYEESIQISWVPFIKSIFGETETGNRTIKRREINADLLDEWDVIGYTSSNQFTDYSIIAGKEYRYRIFNEYNSDFFTYAKYMGPTYLAKTPLDLNLTGVDNYELFHIDQNTLAAITNIRFEVTDQYGNSPTGTVVEYYITEIGKSEKLQSNTNTTGGNVNYQVEVAGEFILYARASSDLVRIWSDWMEFSFSTSPPSEEPVSSLTTSDETSDTEPEVNGFELMFALISLVMIYPIKRKKYAK